MIGLLAAVALQPAEAPAPDAAFDMVVTAQRPNTTAFEPPAAFFRRH